MSSAAPEDDVPHRVFEGLFAAGVEPTPALLEELKAAGYDRSAPRPAYPVQTWRATVEITRRHVLPELGEDEGRFELGRRFLAGFARTPVGWVLARVAPLFGVDRTIQAVPRYLRAVRKHMQVELVLVEEKTWRLFAEDPMPMPHFIGGCMQGILDIFSITGTITVSNVRPTGFELLITWR